MKKITKVSKRSMYHEDDGLACGPVSSTAIVTEIVVDVGGQRVYLHGEWVDTAEEYYFEATAESLFDVYEKMSKAPNDDELEEILAECDRIDQERIQDDSAFEPFYAEMKQMIEAEMDAHGIAEV